MIIKYSLRLIFILLALWQFNLPAAENCEKDDLFAKGITVDLREPEYSEGILKTDKGGIIIGPDMRLQARHIVYTRKVVEGKPVFNIEAEGDLFIELGDYAFVGERLEYDFQEKRGVIYEGRTEVEPWFFGGQTIYLEPDGSYVIKEGFITTSENYNMDWRITAREASLAENKFLKAKDVKFLIAHRTLFWLPTFRANLDSIFDSPIRYNFRWDGRQGPRASLAYEVFSWRRLKAFLRLDWRLNRGLGIGFETYLRSPDRKEEFETVNYIARDSAIIHPHEHVRYRYQGLYRNLLYDDRLSFKMSWDKLSDKEMATDYKDKGLELDTAGRTELHVRHDEKFAVTNFYTRVRVNPFQTIKQELPTLETHLRPFNIFNTGVISDTQAKVAYLDFKYSNSLIHVHDYNSTRYELSQNFYRSFRLGPVTATPQLGGMAIYYGNTPEKRPRWVAFGEFGCEINSRFYRYYNNFKHVFVPFASYTYYTFPTTDPNRHYIFDIQDGWSA